jgi:hypothetical protein
MVAEFHFPQAAIFVIVPSFRRLQNDGLARDGKTERTASSTVEWLTEWNSSIFV